MKSLAGNHIKPIIKVIGLGGGGCHTTTHMFQRGIPFVHCSLCDSDYQSLELSPATNKFQIGTSLTRPPKSRSFPPHRTMPLLEKIDDVKQMIGFNTKILIVLAGLGGKTVSYVLPIIAKAARDIDVPILAIVSTPFLFEGKQRHLVAEEGIVALKKQVDSFIVVSHHRLCQLSGELSLGSAFEPANRIFTVAVKSIAHSKGFNNVSIKDLRRALKNGGLSVMSFSSAIGEHRSLETIKGALSDSQFEDHKIKDASHILLSIGTGDKELSIDEAVIIIDSIEEKTGLKAELIWSNYTDLALGEKLSLTLIAIGFNDSAKNAKQQSQRHQPDQED